MVRSSPVRKITVTIDGVDYEGTYYSHATMVYAQYGAGREQTQIGGSTPESVAHMLLTELVRVSLGLKARG